MYCIVVMTSQYEVVQACLLKQGWAHKGARTCLDHAVKQFNLQHGGEGSVRGHRKRVQNVVHAG